MGLIIIYEKNSLNKDFLSKLCLIKATDTFNFHFMLPKLSVT